MTELHLADDFDMEPVFWADGYDFLRVPLDDDETVRRLLLILTWGHAPAPTTEKAAEKWIDWVHDVRVNMAILMNVVEGKFEVTWPEDGDEPKFRISQRGKGYVERELLHRRKE